MFEKLLLDIKNKNHKLVLLYRFHILIIFVNILAITMDFYNAKYNNALVELFTVFFLIINLIYLRKYFNLIKSSYIFIFIVSFSLFTLIYINHFATMSIVFVLLLPLTIVLFVKLRASIIITLIMFTTMAILLYIEHLNNPNNPLIQNSQALFNLAYTAGIIYLFAIFYHFLILKTFDELDASDHQKELLLKEVHHRVKNNLNVIASIIGLQGANLSGKEKEQLLKSKSRIESIAIVHEMLYKHEDFESIEFESYMKRLSQLLLSMYSTNKKIDVSIKSDTKNMPLDVMVQLGIMMNELLTNSIKYAFENEEGHINIELSHQNSMYKFIYFDNGTGSKEPQKLLKSKSLGIKLISLTAKQLKGSLKISSPKGLKYEIEFKS